MSKPDTEKTKGVGEMSLAEAAERFEDHLAALGWRQWAKDAASRGETGLAMMALRLADECEDAANAPKEKR